MKKTEPAPLSIIPDGRPPLSINPGSATGQNLSPIPYTGFTKSATCTKNCWGTGVLYWNSTSVKIYVQLLMRREDNNMSSTY